MGDRAALSELAKGFRDLARVCVRIEAAFGDLAAGPTEPRPRAPRRKPEPTVEGGAAPIAGSKDELTKTERRILIPLAQSGRALSAKQIGVWSGLSSKTGTFRAAVTSLRQAGYVVGDVGQLRATEDGLQALGTYPRLPEGHALFDFWREKLSGTCHKILTALRTASGSPSAPEVGELTGLSHATGTFRAALTKLRALDLIEGDTKGLQFTPMFRDAIAPTIGVHNTSTGRSVRVKAR